VISAKGLIYMVGEGLIRDKGQMDEIRAGEGLKWVPQLGHTKAAEHNTSGFLLLLLLFKSYSYFF
jgi:hypothetical protein